MVRGLWWKQQFRGLIAFYAAFIGVSQKIFRDLAPLSNSGARKIAGLGARCNVHSLLAIAKADFSICLHHFFVRTVVKWLGHCFRHHSQPVSALMSLPLDGRLADIRARGSQTDVSQSARSFWSLLSDVGLNLDFPVTGRLAVRGQSGYAFRWGEGWLGPIRDGRVG